MPVGLVFLALIAAPMIASGGRVVDARTHQPVASAEVTIAGVRGSVRTDAEGRFVWPAATAPPIEVIVILRDGRAARPVRLAAIDPQVETLIAIDTSMAEAVVVHGVAPEIDAAAGAASIHLTGADIALRNPLTFAQTLESVAGVSLISEGQAATPAIRGLARGRTLLVIDGARVSAERGAGPNGAFLDPAVISSVDVARGPGSVAYGSDAFGGVVAARTRGPDVSGPLRVRARFTGAAGLPERRGDVEISSGYGTGGILFGARARDVGDYISPSGPVPHSSWRDAGARVRWDHLQGIARWSIGWQSEIGRDIGRPRSDSSTTQTTTPIEDVHRLTISYTRSRLAGLRDLRIDALAGASRQRTDQDRLAAPGRPRRLDRADVSARDLQVRATTVAPIGRARIRAGVDVQGRYGLTATDTAFIYSTAGAQASATTSLSIDNARRTLAGLFAESGAPVTKWLRASAGIRGEFISSVNRGGFFGDRSISHRAMSGMAAVTVTPTTSLTLVGQIARGFRDPTLTDRFYRGPVGRGFIEGNPALAPERSVQVDLKATYTAGPLVLGAAVYDYRLTDLVERYSASPDLFLFRNRGRARLDGAELEAHLSLPRGFALDATAQVSRGRDDNDHTPLDDIAPRAVSVALRHAAGDRFTSYARISATGRHSLAGPTEVPTPGCTIVDAAISWRVSRWLDVRGSVRNALDASYYSSAGPRWVWAPGRQGEISVVVRGDR